MVTKVKTPHGVTFAAFLKLPGQDSNLDKESQNFIAALFTPSAILANFSQMSMPQGSGATFLT
jgi:hypothetical protein